MNSRGKTVLFLASDVWLRAGRLPSLLLPFKFSGDGPMVFDRLSSMKQMRNASGFFGSHHLDFIRPIATASFFHASAARPHPLTSVAPFRGSSGIDGCATHAHLNVLSSAVGHCSRRSSTARCWVVSPFSRMQLTCSQFKQCRYFMRSASMSDLAFPIPIMFAKMPPLSVGRSFLYTR